jgi:hypothetical protein
MRLSLDILALSVSLPLAITAQGGAFRAYHLTDVGLQTVRVRSPRAGHGLRETKRLVDVLERSTGCYELWFWVL